MNYSDELTAALEAARKAGELILRHYRDFEQIHDPRIDISTIADRESQELILTHLHHTFPTDALCAEENTPSLADLPATGDRQWIVDPIDGSRGFAKKNGEFSVMIAFVHRRELAVGVVLEPATGLTTYAVRGGGCWRQDHQEAPVPCQVSTTSLLSESTLIQSHSKSAAEPSWPVQAISPRRVVEVYSAGVKLARVARGEVDLYVNTYNAFHDWDIAAGHLLVTEAGGQVSGLGGELLIYGEPGAKQLHGLLGTNGLLHRDSLARLKRPC